MKKLLFISALFLTHLIYSQVFTRSDFTINVHGLSEEYTARFKDTNNIDQIVTAFNRLKIIHDVAPVLIHVSSKGFVRAELNYNHDKIFKTTNRYSKHNNSWSGRGKGISVLLPHQVFQALGQYLKSVATKGYTKDKEVLNFISLVKYNKANGDWLSFYASNYYNHRGFYIQSIQYYVHAKVGGHSCEIHTSNTEALNKIKFFWVDKTVGIDGKKTPAFYFCKFFNIKPNN